MTAVADAGSLPFAYGTTQNLPQGWAVDVDPITGYPTYYDYTNTNGVPWGSTVTQADTPSGNGYTAPAGSAAPTAAPAASGSSLTNSMFGNPAAAQPLPFSAFGSIPQISPTFTQPATIDPNVGAPGTVNDPDANPMMNQGTINQYEQAVQQSLAPTFQQQQQAQDQAMAARGIFNSSAAQDAQTQLQGTQSATLAGAYAPIISSAQTGQQQAASQNAAQGTAADTTGFNAYEQNLLANQNAATGANTFNATAANQATAGNAATQLGIEQGDQSQYNAFEQALLGYGNQTGQSELGALLNSYSPTGSNILGAGATSAGNAASSALQNYNGSGLSNSISNVFSGLGNAGNNSVTTNQGTGTLQSNAQ